MEEATNGAEVYFDPGVKLNCSFAIVLWFEECVKMMERGWVATLAPSPCAEIYSALTQVSQHRL